MYIQEIKEDCVLKLSKFLNIDEEWQSMVKMPYFM